MSEDQWDSVEREENVDYSEEYGEDTFAVVNNKRIQLTPGEPFKDTIIGLSRDAGMGKFRTFLNGEEIKPSNAPDTIAEGAVVEIRPYDVAG